MIFHAAIREILNEEIYIPEVNRRVFLEFNDIAKVWLGNALFLP